MGKIEKPDDKRMEFNILLNNKLKEMYDDNKISEADKHDIRLYTEMFRKAFKFDNSTCDFNTFEIYQIQRGTEFLEIDKDEYGMNEFAEEVCEYFFNLNYCANEDSNK